MLYSWNTLREMGSRDYMRCGETLYKDTIIRIGSQRINGLGIAMILGKKHR